MLQINAISDSATAVALIHTLPGKGRSALGKSGKHRDKIPPRLPD